MIDEDAILHLSISVVLSRQSIVHVVYFEYHKMEMKICLDDVDVCTYESLLVQTVVQCCQV